MCLPCLSILGELDLLASHPLNRAISIDLTGGTGTSGLGK